MALFLAENAQDAAKNAAEKVAIGDGFLYALLGFGIVLLVLVVLMGFIYLLSYVARKSDGLFAKKPKQEAAPSAAPALAPGSSGNVKLNNVDDRTAAMVMAIVADEMQTPLNELRFISIKEIQDADGGESLAK